MVILNASTVMEFAYWFVVLKTRKHSYPSLGLGSKTSSYPLTLGATATLHHWYQSDSYITQNTTDNCLYCLKERNSTSACLALNMKKSLTDRLHHLNWAAAMATGQHLSLKRNCSSLLGRWHYNLMCHFSCEDSLSQSIFSWLERMSHQAVFKNQQSNIRLNVRYNQQDLFQIIRVDW